VSRVGRGFDLALGLVAVAVCTLAVFFYVSNLVSAEAGGLLGAGVLLSGLAVVIGGHLNDERLRRLLAGVCPSCGAAIASEHQHRRWQPERGEWLAASVVWECRACGFNHSERWTCPSCSDHP
jgi:hypothetical protein